MTAEDFCNEIDEAMGEDGWVQTIDLGDPANIIMRKLMSYIRWLRSERFEEHCAKQNQAKM